MKCYSIILCAGLVLSCSTGPDINDRKPVTDYISGQVLYSRDLIGDTFIGITGDTVLMEFYKADNICGIFKVEGDSLVKINEVLYRGRGPNEFLTPMLKISGDSLYAVDRNGRGPGKICRMSLGDLSVMGNNHASWEGSDLTWSNPMKSGSDFQPLGEGRILLTGDVYGAMNILSVLDVRERKRTQVGYWIKDGYTGPVIPKQSIYTAGASLSRKGDRILYVCGEGRYMELLDLRDGKIVDRKAIYSEYPKYADIDGLNFGADIKGNRGMKVYATSDYIYAMLYGSLDYSKTYKGYPCYFFDEVEVYDWEGNFVRNYRTSQPFMTFAVADDDSALYTLSMDLDTSEPQMVKYDL